MGTLRSCTITDRETTHNSGQNRNELLLFVTDCNESCHFTEMSFCPDFRDWLPKVVILTTFGAATDENFVKITFKFRLRETLSIWRCGVTGAANPILEMEKLTTVLFPQRISSKYGWDIDILRCEGKTTSRPSQLWNLPRFTKTWLHRDAFYISIGSPHKWSVIWSLGIFFLFIWTSCWIV